MRIPWTFGSESAWTAIDMAADGRTLAVKVRGPRSGRGQPVVLKCAQSSGVALGERALEELATEVGAGTWTLPLPREDYQVFVVPEPPVPEGDMEPSLRWAVASMLDYPIEEAVLSWMRIPTSGYDATRERQVYVIVARTSVVDAQEAAFIKAKLKLRAVDVRETALRNIATLMDQGQDGLGLVTVGDKGVTTTFTFRGELYLDRFIAQDFEQVVGGGPERQQKFFDRVTQQVHQSMEIISHRYPFITVRRIVVAPMPAPLPLAAHLAGKLAVRVDSLDLTTVFDVSAAPQLRKLEVQARYLVALGAALRDMKGAVA